MLSSMRGSGAGRALMSWVARDAIENGCCRIDWSVQAFNHKGIAFYEGLGAVRVADRLSYRLSAPAIHDFPRGAGTTQEPELNASPAPRRS